MDATQDVKCEKSPTGEHGWWSYGWADATATGDPVHTCYCLYCGKKREQAERVIVENSDG